MDTLLSENKVEKSIVINDEEGIDTIYNIS